MGEPPSIGKGILTPPIPHTISVVVIVVVGILLFMIRQLAAPNLLDQDQERPAAYVLDVVQNRNWICQRDHLYDVTSKPPLLTWLCAITALATGHVNEFSLYLPGALAALGTALMLWRAGTRYFGAPSGFIAAMAVMLTTAGLKGFGLARTDGVFAFTVAATALLAFGAWRRGKGWTWAWMMAAASVLAKGPLGPLIAGGGLIAAFWERKTGAPAPIRGKQWIGITLFLLITGGWFWLAYLQDGHALIAKMLGKELVAHAVTDGKKHYPGMLFYQPILYYLGRAAPWSVFALYGMYRLYKKPSADGMVRQFERFLFCWFVFGLCMFSLAPHQRADLLWPIMPAGALLAGRELSSLSSRLTPATFRWATTATLLFAIGGYSFYYFGPRSREKIQQQSLALRDFARRMKPPQGVVLTHVDDPMALQIYIDTLHRKVSFEEAAKILRGKAPAYVVIKDLGKLEASRLNDDPPLQVIAESSPLLGLKIVANRTTWETNEIAFGSGWLSADVRGATVATLREHEIEADAKSRGDIRAMNRSDTRQALTLKVRRDTGVLKERRLLLPGEVWSFSFPEK